MRGIVAKQLRKAAERVTAQLPDRRLVWVAPATNKKVVGARPVMLAHRNCTRAVYRDMKKRAKKKEKRNA